MKFKIVTNGEEYKILKKFLWWWIPSKLPEYHSISECEKAIFRLWSVVPHHIEVENLQSKHRTDKIIESKTLSSKVSQDVERICRTYW